MWSDWSILSWWTQHNLLISSQLCDTSFDILFNAIRCTVNIATKNIILFGDPVQNIYVLNNIDLPTLTYLTTFSCDQWLWHRKLGYASMYVVEKLSRHKLVIGPPKLNFEKDQFFDSCQLSKHTHHSFKVKNILSTFNPFQPLYVNLFGPTRTSSIGEKRYVFLVVDDFYRFTWVIFLAYKVDAFANFEVFCRKIEREANYFICTIHNDRVEEFKNTFFKEFYAKNGYNHSLSSPQSPQQDFLLNEKIILFKILFELCSWNKVYLTLLEKDSMYILSYPR